MPHYKKRRIKINRKRLSELISRGRSIQACADRLGVSTRRIRDELADMKLEAANKAPNPRGVTYGNHGMPKPLMTEAQIADRYEGRRYDRS